MSAPADPPAGDACTASSPDAAPRADWPAAVEALARPLGGPAPSRLAELTTLRVGGPLAAYAEARTESELVEAVQDADASRTPLLVIGGGSNVLVSDAGFDGIVVRDARQDVQVVSDTSCGGVELTATAGTTWDDLVRQAVASDWFGFAPLSGIPGTVGAAPVQNIGAYGAQAADVLASVRAWDRLAGRVVHLPLARLHLAYRDSDIKRSLADAAVGGGRTWGPTGRWVVLSATFHVPRASLAAPVAYQQLADALGVALGQRVPARDVREAVLGLRRSKGMVLDSGDHDTWSAGSFFTNPVLSAEEAQALPREAPRFPVDPEVPGSPVKTSAAWLIDHAGFTKGFALAGDAPASLSTKHVLALTNRGQALARDLVALRDAVVSGVSRRFGVGLVPEPVHVGFGAGPGTGPGAGPGH